MTAKPPVGERAAAPTSRRVGKITGSFWFNLVAAVVVLALIQTFVAKLYYVPSGSMEDTLEIGDRVVVSRLAYLGNAPATGDVIVFNASDSWEEPPEPPANPIKFAIKWFGGVVGIGPSLDHTLIKRVIAGPGQTVACCSADGRMIVDGKPIDEPYTINDFAFEPGTLDCATDPVSRRCVNEFTVPEDQYVVLGDNRSHSSDSLYECRGAPELGTCVRTVKRNDIVGKLFVVLLPLGNFGPPTSAK